MLVRLHVADLHQAVDGCGDLRVLQLGLIVELRGIVLDLRALGVVPVSCVLLLGETAAVVKDLLPLQLKLLLQVHLKLLLKLLLLRVLQLVLHKVVWQDSHKVWLLHT